MPQAAAEFERHTRKCQICSHPDREAIEEAFVHWVKPTGITRLYDVPWVSLYRHAHALDLFARRRDKIRSVLDNILERGVETDITGDTVLRAVRAYSCLTDDNKWVEPASRVIFSTAPARDLLPPAAAVVMASLPEAPPMALPAQISPPRLNHQAFSIPTLIDTQND